MELDDGPRMYGQISGAPGSFALDTPVEATFDEVVPGVSLVCWAPRAAVVNER